MDAQGPLGGSPDRRRALGGDGGNLKYVMIGLVLAVAGAFFYVQRHYGAVETQPAAAAATVPVPAVPVPVVPAATPEPHAPPPAAAPPKMVVQPLDPSPAAPAKPVQAKAPKVRRHAPHTAASSSLPHLPTPPPGDDG